VRVATLDRFTAKYEVDAGGCWLWTASRDWGGYARLGVNGKASKAHRWAYEHFVGPIPPGLELDHLCRVRHCVNPAHLEPVTRRENVRRGIGQLHKLNAVKTHCKHGHPFDEQNTITYTYKGRTHRGCRTCRPIVEARYRKRHARKAA
jgi:hypothetical protein